MTRNEIEIVFPDKSEQRGYALTNDENELLDQFLQTLSGGSEVLDRFLQSRRQTIENFVSYVMAKETGSFTGMRDATSAVGIMALHPLHIDSNVADWRFNPATLASKGWTTRSDGSGTAYFSDVTIPDNLYPCILGVQITADLTDVSPSDYNKIPTAVKYTVDGKTSLPVDFYSQGIGGDDNTQLIPVPPKLVNEASTFKEEVYFPTAITTGEQKFFIREFGFTLGPGNALNSSV